jgi:hypothetical protein
MMSQNDEIVAEICSLAWPRLTDHEALDVAVSYYFFSIQFRENLELACALFPQDLLLQRLKAEECDTDNLSPFPGVAALGERMNHDEFMRRALRLTPRTAAICDSLMEAGARYLTRVRAVDPAIRAASIRSYEDGGLESVFKAMLTQPKYDQPTLHAFRFFLSEHIRFDSDPAGHGTLSRHLANDDDVAVLWWAFRELLVDVTPALLHVPQEKMLYAAAQL